MFYIALWELIREISTGLIIDRPSGRQPFSCYVKHRDRMFVNYRQHNAYNDTLIK